MSFSNNPRRAADNVLMGKAFGSALIATGVLQVAIHELIGCKPSP